MSDSLYSPYPEQVYEPKLDPTDPIDRLVIDYRTQLMEDATPPDDTQIDLISEMRIGILESARELVAVNKGLVAASVHPYKHTGLESDRLLIIGGKLLLNAASKFNVDGGASFPDQAVRTIQEDLSKVVAPPVPEILVSRSSERPAYALGRYVMLHEPLPDLSKKEDQAINSTKEETPYAPSLQELPPKQRSVIKNLYLTNRSIASELTIAENTVRTHINEANKKLGLTSAVELAVYAAMRDGVDLSLIPEQCTTNHLDLKQQELISNFWGHTIQEASEALGTPFGTLNSRWNVIIRSTGSVNRRQAVLVAFRDKLINTDRLLMAEEVPV